MKYIIQFIAVSLLHYPFMYMFGANVDNYSLFDPIPLALILTFGTYCQDVYRKENEEIETN